MDSYNADLMVTINPEAVIFRQPLVWKIGSNLRAYGEFSIELTVASGWIELETLGTQQLAHERVAESYKGC